MEKSKIVFILYKPAVPGNIGASARAMKTMGFHNLRLIEPADHLSDEARMLAHGSQDILEQSRVFSSFDEAVSDLDFIICTTAKQKSAKVDYLPSGRVLPFLSEKIPLVRKIGIVFGSEESGLPNTIIQRTNAGVHIPMAGSYPSLNLSQAVMLIAYELSKLAEEVPENIDEQQEATWRELQERSSSLLIEAGIKPSTPLYHRILERMSFLSASDARLAHSISSKIKKLIDNNKK